MCAAAWRTGPSRSPRRSWPGTCTSAPVTSANRRTRWFARGFCDHDRAREAGTHWGTAQGTFRAEVLETAQGCEGEGHGDGPAVRRAELTFRLSEFEVPPVDDCLLIGRRAAIGAEAARRMAEAIAPGQYEVIRLDHPQVEAIIARANLLNKLPREPLISLLVEEFERSATDRAVWKARIHVAVHVRRALRLT